MPICLKPTSKRINNPTVSVIMCAYNSENTIEQAICSVLEQTFDDYEFIICDDASTDGTWKELNKWMAADPRIILLRNEKNLGSGPARNICINRAKGKYIALMDADDYSYPERLSAQVAILNAMPELGFVGTKGEFFYEKPGDLGQHYWFISEPQKKDFLMTLPFVHASLMFRCEVLHQLGGYADSKMVTRSEDYDMLMRAYANSHHGINLPTPLYGIRLNQETYLRRKYRYRFCECFVKLKGFSNMGLMLRGFPYAFKPLFVGLIPVKLLNRMKDSYYSKTGE